MGRPLNKKFFGDLATSGFQISCTAWFTGELAPQDAYIVKQRKNTKFVVADVATDLLLDSCVLVDGVPGAEGEMAIEVQAENAETPVEATFTFSTSGAGVVNDVTIVDGGYGYWVDGTFNITVASDAGYVAGTESIVSYTVSNGVIVSVLFTPGSGYSFSLTDDPIAAADVDDPAANPPLQYASKINAHRVYTFDGNFFVWPITAPLGADENGLTQADIEGS